MRGKARSAVVCCLAVLVAVLWVSFPGQAAADGEYLDEIQSVAAGGDHSCALRASGEVLCWGANWSGQLGRGSAAHSLVPAAVFELTDATAIAAGRNHSCAIRASGEVLCWGANWSGQLGDGSEVDSLVPVSVSGLTDATAISAGGDHSCAVRASGQAVCWGSNFRGQLGNGSEADSQVPVSVSGLTDATAITAGSIHSCGLRASGQALCWGANQSGQLGNGAKVGSLVPVSVSGLTDATAITAGSGHSCATRASGQAVCWGSNAGGRLGNGSGSESSVPVSVSGLANAISISVGAEHSCAVRETGQAVCWGENTEGQLGDDKGVSSLVPSPVSGLTGAAGIAAGHAHTCAATAAGAAYCWGDNVVGQVGDGTVANRTKPVPAVAFIRPGLAGPRLAPRITSAPADTGVATEASFSFEVEPDEVEMVAAFECRLDDGAFQSCQSPKAYSGLSLGEHTFRVRTVNSVGAGPAATRTWTVTSPPVIQPTPRPRLAALKVNPKRKAVRRGRSIVIKVNVRNAGTAAAKAARVCVTSPKRLVTVRKCVKAGVLNPGKARTVSFKVKVKPKARRGARATLTFKATATGIAAQQARTILKIA